MDEAKEKLIVEAYLMRDDRGRYLPVSKICAEFGIYPTQLYAAVDHQGSPRRTEVVERMLPPSIEPDPNAGKLALVNARGIKRRIEDLYPPEVHVRTVHEYLDEGLAAIEISKLHGMPYSHVLRILHNARVSVIAGVGSKRSWIKVRHQIIEDLRESNLDIDAICVKHGVSKGVLLKAIEREDGTKVAAAVEKVRNEGKVTMLVEEVLSRVRLEMKAEIAALQHDGQMRQLEMFDSVDMLVMNTVSEDEMQKRVERERGTQ